METSVIIEFINALGFPTAICIALFWSNRETVKHYEKLLLDFKRSIDKNTESMTLLHDQIRNGKK